VELEDRITIATAEGVELELQLAGLGSRMIAGGIDFALQLTALGVVATATGVLASDSGSGIAVAVFALLAFAILYLYNVLFEVFGGGRTPGKRWNQLRVVRVFGGPVDVPASAIRNVLRLIEGPPLLGIPAMVSILATRRNQRLGDLAAGTLVIREQRQARRRRGGRGARRAAAQEQTDVALAAAVGDDTSWDVSAVSAQELAMVRRYLDRRETLDPGARRELAFQLQQGLRAKVAGVPERLSPERFLEAIAERKARVR
jgi:uncharacterized RDD family membrane protein YckC